MVAHSQSLSLQFEYMPVRLQSQLMFVCHDYIVMIHVFQESQLTVASLRMDLTLEWPGQFLHSHTYLLHCVQC